MVTVALLVGSTLVQANDQDRELFSATAKAGNDFSAMNQAKAVAMGDCELKYPFCTVSEQASNCRGFSPFFASDYYECKAVVIGNNKVATMSSGKYCYGREGFKFHGPKEKVEQNASKNAKVKAVQLCEERTGMKCIASETVQLRYYEKGYTSIWEKMLGDFASCASVEAIATARRSK